MAVTTATKASLNQNDAVSDGIGSIPAAAAPYVSKVEIGGRNILRKTQFTFAALPVAIADQTTNGAWGGTQFFTFPVGRIVILGSICDLTFTTTTTLASTLNASVANVEFGIGTAVAAAVLATTAMNILPGTGQTTAKFTSSATINVASAAVQSALVVSSTAQFDGTTTAIAAFLNIGVTAANNADIDGDATVTVAGTATILWMSVGDY